MSNEAGDIVDWNIFSEMRAELGAGFVRIFGYFREDGTKAVAAIEEAMRRRNAAALVAPAETLSDEALQFGARPLAEIADRIEIVARRCVEQREGPEELLQDVIALRPLFDETIALLDREANPLIERRPSLVRRASQAVPEGYGPA